jgi:hypothetical protein
MRREILRFLDALPAELQQDPVAQHLRGMGCRARMDIVQLIYRPAEPQGSQKDFQFDRGSMERRWAAGRHDAEATLRAAPWQVPPPPDVAVRSFDVLRPPGG